MSYPYRDKLKISLTLIPPVTVTDKISVSIRGAIWNNDCIHNSVKASFYLNTIEPVTLLFSNTISIAPKSSEYISYLWPTKGHIGKNKIIFVVEFRNEKYSTHRTIEVVHSDYRSTRRIEGSWLGIYHWNDQEAKSWNSHLKIMTDNEWKQLVRDMHSIGFNILNIQEVFRNQEYYGQHNIVKKGYKGRAFYDSELFPGRMQIAANDPIEAILSEADMLDMHVFLGIGMYAWFDYSDHSLQWHKEVAEEIWRKYGHHKSFYGFKISEEGDGSLGLFGCEDKQVNDRCREELVRFFQEFTPFCRKLAPDKPVMVARNAWRIREGLKTYPAFLENLDILCSFAFNRMPEGDLTAIMATSMLQSFCDNHDTHYWMNIELFDFDIKVALVPRAIDCLIKELKSLTTFETLLCYQYPGLMNSPEFPVPLGGINAMKLHQDYCCYLEALTK